MTRRWVNARLLLAAGGMLVASYALAFLWGGVRGVEFSPDRFAHRSFRYWELPFLQVQLTPRQTEVWKTPLEEYLHDHGYVPATRAQSERWRLVKGLRTGVRGWSGRAKVLCQSLGCWGDNSGEWVRWSQDNPEMAAILWPKIIALAREEKYGEASKLLEIAVGYKGTVAEFREDILLFWPPDPATGSWAPTEDGDDQARTGLKDESK